MDNQYEGDGMQDLLDDSPNRSDDDAFEDAAGDGFEEDGMEEEAMYDGMEAMDGFDEGGDGFADEGDGYEDSYEEMMGDEFTEAGEDAGEAFENAVADALDAEDSDEFLSNLMGVINAVRRGAGAVGRAANTAQRVAGQARRVARGVEGVAGAAAGAPRRPARRAGGAGRQAVGGLPAALSQLLPLLRQQAAQGADEMDVFEELADWFEQEGTDEALPVIAGVAARAALRPLLRTGMARVGQTARRQLVRSATAAARQLVGRQGAGAVRSLQRIASSVGNTAARRGLRPEALPRAVQQTAASVAAQPALVRRLSQPTARSGRVAGSAPRSRLVVRGGGGTPRRFVVNGPVEIIFTR